MAKFANFEINVEIEKLKIHVKGDREIAPEVANNVAQQISAIFQPAALIESPKDGQNGRRVVDATPVAPTKRPRKRNAQAATPPGGSTSSINWNHDAAKWGTPLIGWTQPQKLNWLLYVVENAGVMQSMSVKEMAEAFNSKFAAAGQLKRNIERDMKSKSDLFGSFDGRWVLKPGGRESEARL